MMPRMHTRGDMVVGEGTVIEAMGWGKIVVQTIHRDLSIRR